MIKLIALSGICKNQIPADYGFIKDKMHLLITEGEMLKDIEKIMSVFKTLKLKDGFYHWITFDKIVNYKKKE